MIKKMTLWKLCCGLAIALSAFTFTPFVLTAGQHTPELLGVPRTLWLGILIAFTLVAVTWLGGLVHPANDAQEDQHREDNC